MRHLPALLLALSLACAGCSLFEARRTGPPAEGQRRAMGPVSAGGEVVFLNVAVVECPVADPYLDQEVWESGDEQCVELELKPVLEANGLRVAQFGLLPDQLQGLLSSPRSCPSPHCYHTEPDRARPLQIGPVRESCSFALSGPQAKALTFQQARCEFDVVPNLDDEGGVRLRFTPCVRHGKPRRQTVAVRDPDGQVRWAIESAEPTEELTDLRFELTVPHGNFVAIGAWPDRAGTWGHGCFVPQGGKSKHLLVLHASRAPAGEDTARASAPLAVQAGRFSARGSSR